MIKDGLDGLSACTSAVEGASGPPEGGHQTAYCPIDEAIYWRRLAITAQRALREIANGGLWGATNEEAWANVRAHAAKALDPGAGIRPLAGWRSMDSAPRNRRNVWLRPKDLTEWPGGERFLGHWDPDEIGDVGSHWWVDIDRLGRGFDGSWPDDEFMGWMPFTPARITATPAGAQSPSPHSLSAEVHKPKSLKENR